MTHVATATRDDLIHIASWLCDADRHELAVTRDPDDYVGLAMSALASDIHMVALEHDIAPVLAFGAYQIGRGRVHVWGFKTERGVRVMRTVTKYILRIMIPHLRENGIVQATTLVHRDNTLSRRWLAHLGFRPRATPGETGTPLIVYQRDELEHFQPT